MLDILGGIGDVVGAVGNIGLGIGQARREEDAFEYQKSFDRTQMDREDNQLQRFKADATAAGISPIAALGKSGSYGAIGSTVRAPSGSGAAQAGSGASQLGNAARSMAEIALTQAQTNRTLAEKDKVVAETGGIRGSEQRAGEMHDLLMEGQRLQNAQAQDQVDWLGRTFEARVAQPVVNLEISRVNRIIAVQHELINEMRISRDYVDTMLAKAQLAFRSGAESFSFSMFHPAHSGGPDVGLPTGADKFPAVIDFSSLRYPEQVEVLVNQLAIETNGYLRDITRKKKNWFEVLSIGQLITGGAGAVGAYMPYMQGNDSRTRAFEDVPGYGSYGPDRRR